MQSVGSVEVPPRQHTLEIVKKYFNQQKLRSSFFLVNIELLVKIALERVIRSPSDGFGGSGGGGDWRAQRYESQPY